MNLDELYKSILRGKALIFVGSEATINFEKPQHEARSLQKIAEHLGEEYVTFLAQENLFVLKTTKEYDSVDILNDLEEFYKQDFSNPALEKLAEIPFHLFVCLTPDMTLPTIFERKGFQMMHAGYLLAESTVEDTPQAQKPLLYHLFGCIEGGGVENMLITHSDLFEYLQKIYTDNLKLRVIQDNLTKIERIIFLGCDFNKWYLQLILHFLQLGVEKMPRRMKKFSLTEQTEIQTWQEVYESNFDIRFVNQNIGEFITKLHQLFKPEELRKSPATDTKTQGETVQIILQKLRNFIDATDYASYFELIDTNQNTLEYDKSIFNSLRNEYMSGRYTHDYPQRLRTFVGTITAKEHEE